MKRMNPVSFDEYRETYKKPDTFIKFLKESGVDYAVILAEISPITTGIATNEQVEEFCQGHDSLIPFACINPYLETSPARLLEELVVKRGFKGLKLYPTYQYFYPNDHKLYPLYSIAQELGIPIMFHTGSSVFKGARLKYGEPVFFDDLAVDFPDLNMLMVHSGRGFWYDQAFFLARLHPNLYMEIAGLPPQRLLSYFPEFERNANKIIYASDWPGVPDLKNNIQQIRELPISEASKEKILGQNAARILHLI
jgi:predicted TIM-barrel fold metal-dependent hydrolase